MKTLIKLLDKNLDYIKHCIEDNIISIEVVSNIIKAVKLYDDIYFKKTE